MREIGVGVAVLIKNEVGEILLIKRKINLGMDAGVRQEDIWKKMNQLRTVLCESVKKK